MKSIEDIEIFDFYKRRKEIVFSLKLSNIFKDLKRFCTWRIIDLYLLIIVILLITFILPLSGILLIVTLFLLFYLKIPKLADIFDENNKPRSPARTTISFYLIWVVFVTQGFMGQSNFSTLSSTLYDYNISWILLPFTIPWYQVFYLAFPLLPKLPIKNIIKGIIFLLLFVGIFGLILYVCIYIFISLMPPALQKIFSVLIPTVFGLIILFASIKLIKKLWNDFKSLKQAKNKPNSSREQISEYFYKFKTLKGRLKYIQYLQNQSIKPIGNWVNGKLPNHNNDEASTLLAQLEEKWLGLER